MIGVAAATLRSFSSLVLIFSAVRLIRATQIPLSSLPKINASDASRVITPEVSAFIENLRSTSHIPGIALGVVRVAPDSEPDVEFGSWGRMTEEGNGHDMAQDTLIGIASCSKAFLATSLGILMDDFVQGRNVTSLPEGVVQFDWDTKLVDLLPGEWELQDEWASKKTNLRDALGHVSGLPGHAFAVRTDDTTEDVVRRLRKLRPAYELRQTWSYNNLMYMTGAHIVSTYANMSYPSFVTSRIFKPANMTSSTFSFHDAAHSGKLSQLWSLSGRRIPPPGFSTDVLAGPAGVISNTEDLTKWITVLLSKGQNSSLHKQILPASTYNEITTAHYIVPGGLDLPGQVLVGYGAGWFRLSYRGHSVLLHGGAIDGISTLIENLPDDGVGIVILINTSQKGPESEKIMYRLVDDILGLRQKSQDLLDHVSTSVGSRTGDEILASTHLESPAVVDEAPDEPVDLDMYTGTYVDPGYGAVTLCSANSTSSHCLEVLDDFIPFEPSLDGRISSKHLFAKVPRAWASHVRLSHLSGHKFEAAIVLLFPDGYGMNKTAFEDPRFAGLMTEFLVESGTGDGTKRVEGFGVVMNREIAKARERLGGSTSLRDVADAFFVKV